MWWRVLIAGLLTLVLCGQSPQSRFPPGTFNSRAALDAAPAGGNVTADVVGTAVYQATSNNFNSTPLTITAALTNPGLICVLNRADAVNDVVAGLAVTWNGVATTLRSSQQIGGSLNVAFIFGLRNPASGLKTLNVSATNTARDNFVNCVSFSNVNQTSDVLAFPNPTGANAATTVAVTSAAGHVAVGVGFNGATNGTILGTTVINDNTHGGINNVIADYVVSVGASTTVGTSTTQISIAGLDISN